MQRIGKRSYWKSNSITVGVVFFYGAYLSPCRYDRVSIKNERSREPIEKQSIQKRVLNAIGTDGFMIKDTPERAHGCDGCEMGFITWLDTPQIHWCVSWFSTHSSLHIHIYLYTLHILYKAKVDRLNARNRDGKMKATDWGWPNCPTCGTGLWKGDRAEEKDEISPRWR